MSEPFDLKKFFVDPQTFSLTDEKSLVEDEMMTEIFVTDLPADFNAERALLIYSDLMVLENPDVPEAVWASGTAQNKTYLVLAFKLAVDVAETRDALITAIDAEIMNEGYDTQDHPYGLIPSRYNKYSDIKMIANAWRPDSP